MSKAKEISKLFEGTLMYDKSGKNRVIKKGDKVIAIKDYNTKEMSDKDFEDLDNVTVKKGSKGKISYIGSQGEVHFDWGSGKETTDMASGELSEYVVLV